jgi:hypothetical protein
MLGLSVSFAACDASSSTPTPHHDAGSDSTDAAPIGPRPGCERGVIEGDLAGGPPNMPTAPVLVGPGVDPTTGQLIPPTSGEYFVSTTYLSIRGTPEAQQRFGMLMGPMLEDLPSRMSPEGGLVAMGLATSASCGTGRTLTVWRDEAAMLDFVASPAHIQAMTAVTEISTGHSVAIHWTTADASSIDWDDAASRLAVSDAIER